ncbi:MAG: hypothetical protein A2084_00495 [Tenericutes bacterium GWC2_39_45]|nr:MAG: hypothetical protein A2Y43_03240 [Tenericutes bacterium GWA2_38_26]OHE31014.1 MAG: hypothetical protein A2084_00495 [Tenericutes bacterium GWC2_39_45]OHE37554.1 MAG: hypothetical protein A2013_05735 [Tenericutes bacterium GWE2_38_8]
MAENMSLLIMISILSVFLIALYITVEVKGKPLFAFFFKGLASFSFILVFSVIIGLKLSLLHDGLINYQNLRVPVTLLILLGLISGLLGDLYLALRPLQDPKKNETIIISGIVCFSIGHLFYFSALMLLGPLSYLSIILAVIMTLIIYLISKKLGYHMGKAVIPTFVYSALIFLMVGQALGYAIETQFSLFSLIFLAGAILFAVSDLILAPIYYAGNEKRIMVILNLSTYYLAQLFIAISILFIL